MIHFTLNGMARQVDMPSEKPLLWVLRDDLGVTGPKFGCGVALCGACTVYVDGQPARACITGVGDVDGKSVTTIEGLSGRVAQAVQESWTKLDVPQCGYCQSGQVMAATALLSQNKAPSDSDIDNAMSGNLCRCNTYHRIRAAVHDAAKRLGA